MSTNPYAPPKAPLNDAVQAEAWPDLWNPAAAAGWSLLLSPAFGALLHMKNWQALGFPDRASTARWWAVATFAYVAVYSSLAALDEIHLNSVQPGMLVFLLWYGFNGRTQINYVKGRFGIFYPRRGWGIPILWATLAFLVYMACLKAAFIFAQRLMR